MSSAPENRPAADLPHSIRVYLRLSADDLSFAFPAARYNPLPIARTRRSVSHAA